MSELQKRDELVDDAVYKMGQLMEKWKNRLTLDNLRLSERYLKGNLEVQILFREHGRLKSTNLCAVLSRWNCPIRLDSGGRSNFNFLPLPESSRSGAHPNMAFPECRDDQKSVLITNVKLVEFPEIVVSTLVRLGSLDEVYRSRAHSLYLGRRCG